MIKLSLTDDPAQAIEKINSIKDAVNILGRNQEYQVGDIAYTDAIPSNLFLECTTAGTTSPSDIPETKMNEGGTLSDGSVVWTARKVVSHSDVTGVVRTINGVAPDEKGNVNVSSGGGASAKDSFVRKRTILRDGNKVSLYWADPVTQKWKETRIVKKEGGYPEGLNDGTLVVSNNVPNKYLNSPFVDTQANNKNWYYKAFIIDSDGGVTTSEYNRFGFFHYALYVDREDGNEATCVHYLAGYDNEDFFPLKMTFGVNADDGKLDWGDWKNAQFMPKPCMINHDGTVAYYLNPDDYTKKADGTGSDVANKSFDGEAMMEWSPVFVKVVNELNRYYLYFCSEKLDDEYECFSALKSDKSYGEHFYLPIYEGSVINSHMRSLSTGAIPTGSTTMANEVAWSQANGTGWNITTWADENLLQCLGVLITKRLNIAKAIGYNCGSGSSLTHKCGSGNTKGMFFGHYTTSAYATKFFGMENWWGHRWRRIAGMISKNGGYGVSVKMCKSKADGSTTTNYNLDGTGYIDTDMTLPAMSGTYFVDVQASKYGVFVPKAVTKYVGDAATVGGSATTYYCDGGWSSTALTAPFLGGHVVSGALAGLFCLAAANAPSSAAWNVGASLSYRNF